jgi:hypothetical protein
VSGEGRSYISLGVYVGADWRVDCHAYRDSTPILSIRAGAAALAVSPMGREVSEAAVGFARELARQAEQFAAETERVHALQEEGNGKADDSTAA